MKNSTSLGDIISRALDSLSAEADLEKQKTMVIYELTQAFVIGFDKGYGYGQHDEIE